MHFPQIGRGSVAQYPIQRVRRWRSIANQMEGGELIRLIDHSAGTVDWQLSLQELTDVESASLSDLFAATQGGFGKFLFVDPFANLCAWSEDFSRPDWQPGLLQITNGATDPLGGQRASHVYNPSAGVQSLQQTIGMPGDYVGSFSVWMRSGAPTTVTLTRDSHSMPCALGGAWRRFFLSSAGNMGADQSTFAIALPAGQSLEVWGFQAEAQPSPSQYKVSGVALGIYAETYFADDELRIVATGAGLSSCEIRLTSRVQ